LSLYVIVAVVVVVFGCHDLKTAGATRLDTTLTLALFCLLLFVSVFFAGFRLSHWRLQFPPPREREREAAVCAELLLLVTSSVFTKHAE